MPICKTVQCPVEATLSLIGGKYKPLILWHLSSSVLRYGELHRLIPHATDKMLSQHLRELEGDGLILKTTYPVVPPKTEYALTEFGRTVIPVLNVMCSWGQYVLDAEHEASAENTATT